MQQDDNKANLLFVDDEKRVLTSMRAMFRRAYNVSLANSGLEALEVLERKTIDVIVSDQRMPGMTGVEVLKTFKDNAPDAMRILLTGYADQEAIAASINEGEVFRYLTKPCPPDLLKQTIVLAVEAVKGPQLQAPDPAIVADPEVAPDSELAPDSGIAVAPPVRDLPEDLVGSADALLNEVLDTLGEPVPQTRSAAAAQRAPVAPPRKAASLDSKDVELLLLSNDPLLTGALGKALEQSHVLHAVEGIDEAVEVLERHAIGVLITDIAINADEVQELTNQLKQHVPELVTIVASDHSDAHRLIDLINGGQVFRFLLKPIKAKQTSIWIESAVGKHVELVNNPELLARHAVADEAGSSLRKLGDQLVGIVSRVMRFRDRVTQANQA